MYRIAYCSPLNPIASGISDYSEDLLPYLGQYCEIEVFVERGVEPTNQQLRAALPIAPLDTLLREHRRRPYDGVVYHMGNSPAHTGIYEQMQRVPGVVVLHDWVLHHFKLGYRAAHNDLHGYRAELEQRYGTVGQRVARRMLRGQLSDEVFRMPLNEDVIAAARGVIGHSIFVAERVRELRPALAVATVPMGVPIPPPIDRQTARAALDLPDVPIWASFGHINPYKRIEPALRAFRQFRASYADAIYLLVGSVSPNYDLHGLIRRLDLGAAVRITGYVASDQFNYYVAAADLCLNLRYPTAGETSASALRLLATGRPTLVSAVDAFIELPAGVCARVDVDRAESALIAGYALVLRRQPALAAALGAAARAYVAAEHSLPRAAKAYVDFLSTIYGWHPPAPTRPPLWEVEAQQPGTLPDPTPPPAPEPTGTSPIPGVGQALAELGLRADDQGPLVDIAAIIADLWAEAEPAPGRRQVRR